MIRFLSLVFTVAVSFSAGAQEALSTQSSQTHLPGLLSAILVQTPAVPGTFVKLLHAPLGAIANSTSGRPLESGKPKPRTMLAISCRDQDQPQDTQSLLIHCRTDGYISTVVPGGRFVIKGVVTDDVVSAGKILIAAGSKVAGIGHIDPDSGRLESKGNWSIIAESREVRVHGEVQEAETGFHGLQGKETSVEPEDSQRQAVVRDGRYYFLADKTPFVLSITGAVSVTELQPLDSPE
jgi:hypothetical protein